MNRSKPKPVQFPPPPGLEVQLIEIGGTEYAILSFPKQPSKALPQLTPAEQDVLSDLLRGAPTQRIAERRGTSPRTVSNQIARIFCAYGVSSRTELLSLCGARF
jgi:DNA-binding NarL/FixJ family response regulator